MAPPIPSRIGVFGGTFDPPHIGHLFAAVEIRDQLGLDRVLLTVANRPWQKVGSRPITDATTRLSMVAAAVEGLEGVEASDLEIRRGGDSYTADTLDELHRREPDAELFVILGSDAAALIDTWDRVDEVLAAATIVAYDRYQSAAPVQPVLREEIHHVPMPLMELSSTEVRARVAEGRRIDVLCPPAVVRIVDHLGLYRVGDS